MIFAHDPKIRQENIARIVLLVPEQYLEDVTAEVNANISNNVSNKITVLPGCESRHRTIRRGVIELDRHRIDLTIIHDAVRPLVPLMDQLIAAAAKFGASGPVTKLTSTVLSLDENGFLDQVLTRNQFMDSQMPQVFRHEVIREAYDHCTPDELDNGTECLALVQKYSSRRSSIKLIEGDPNSLWKVTHKKDLHLTLMALPDSIRDGRHVYLLMDESDSRTEARQSITQQVEQSLDTFCKAVTKISLRGLNGLSNGEGNVTLRVVLRFSSSVEEFAVRVRELESCSESWPSMLVIMILESAEQRRSMTPFFSELEGIVRHRGSGRMTAAILYFLNHSPVRLTAVLR
jgi:2-C-methyl-D-erythritol 4-phosphate cytidylyltransferase